MASRNSRKSISVAPQKSESEEDMQSSRDTDEDLIIAAANLMSNTQNQRDMKRKTLEDQHKKRVKEFSTKIDDSFEKKKNRVTKSQQVVWNRLEALNKKRQNLEYQILVSMKTIEAHTSNIANELSAMFQGRAESIIEHDEEQQSKI